MNSLRKLNEVQARIDAFPEGESAFGFVFDKVISATQAEKDGQIVVLAGSNNYLGLNYHPQVLAASTNATRELGLGTTGSRLANGTYQIHEQLEHELSQFFGCSQALTFSTGYQANLGILSSLCEPETVFIVDGESHASIIDGCRLGGAKMRRFKHNDVADLSRKLRSIKAKRKIVVVEGIYSMSGDVAPLRQIADIVDEDGTLLVVDEAHSVGVLGKRGRGLAEALDVEDKVDVIVGTFSKSLGAIGGFAVSKNLDLLHLKYVSRPYIFSASLPPGVVEGVRTGLRLIESEPALRDRLRMNISSLGKLFDALNLSVGHPEVPIFAVPITSVKQAFRVWSSLMEKSVYVNLIIPPASPQSLPMLRLSVSASHSKEEIEQIGDALSYAIQANPASD